MQSDFDVTHRFLPKSSKAGSGYFWTIDPMASGLHVCPVYKIWKIEQEFK